MSNIKQNTNPGEDFVTVKSVGKKRGFGGYAHFPGTGPENTFCYQCDFFYENKSALRCKKWFERAHGTSHIDKAPPIIRSTASCKYYERA
jgi:hypothetical protein